MSAQPLSRAEFVARFGAVYEQSPWIAEAVFDTGLTDEFADCDRLRTCFRDAVSHASHQAQIQLLRAHPDLADRLALSAESASEQKSAGLDACSPEELRIFQELNAAYKAKFGFPFIVAVRGMDRARVLAAFRQRLNNSADVELEIALSEVNKIAAFRLRDLFDGK